MKSKSFLLLMTMCVLGSATQAYGQTPVSKSITRKSLEIGQPAPPLMIYGWLKGTPVSTFKKGKIYLIDFNNTGCAPCINTITQLRKIANNYKGMVEVVSIYNHEYGYALEKHWDYVKRRIEMLGEQINFTVAMDVPEQTTEVYWNGNTTNYAIVDQEGKIAFTGSSHDGEEIDEVLTTILNGKANLQPKLDSQVRMHEMAAKLKNSVIKLSQSRYAERIISGRDSLEWMDSIRAENKKIDGLLTCYSNRHKLSDIKIWGLTVLGDPSAVNNYLSELIEQDEKSVYFDWAIAMRELRIIKNTFPAIFENLNKELLLTVINRAIDDDPLVISVPSYIQFKESIYLLLGRFDDAKKLLDSDQTGNNKIVFFRNPEMHHLILDYLVKEKHSGKSKAAQWVKSRLSAEAEMKKFRNIIYDYFGYTTMSLKFLEALPATSNIHLAKELLSDKARIYEGMKEYQKALEMIEQAQNLAKAAGNAEKYAREINKYKIGVKYAPKTNL